MFRPPLILLLAGLVIAALGPATAASSPADPSPAPVSPMPAPATASQPAQASSLPPADMNHLPWADGETLSYVVSYYTTLNAAQGTFTARKKGENWEFDLKLNSSGLMDQIYPFTDFFWSQLASGPWRSIEYGEYRFEYSRTIKERTRIDYAAHLGTREMWSQGKSETFPIAEAGVDDVGTMLYHLRAYPWKPGDKRTLYVYESSSEKQGEVECQAREKRAFGSWPSQWMLRLMALPTVGTHRKGHLEVWLTDDARRLPLHAEIEFRYGTFDIDLVKADKTLPMAP